MLEEVKDPGDNLTARDYLLRWDTRVPNGIGMRKWRRIQINRFLRKYPKSIGHPVQILQWIDAHNPSPWPKCTANALCKIMKTLPSPELDIQYQALAKTSTSNMDISIDTCVVSYDLLPQIIFWDYDRKSGTSVSEWRKIQLTRYLNQFPNYTPLKVFNWLKSQDPHPWPAVSLNNLGKLTRSLKVSPVYQYVSSAYSLSVSSGNTKITVEPLDFGWDYARPPNCDELQWRKIQVRNHVQRFPNDTPTKIFRSINALKPKPWPNVTINSLGKLVRNLKKDHSLVSEKYVSATDLAFQTSSIVIKPVTLHWDFRKPEKLPAQSWRRIQISRFLATSPEARPRDILEWMNSQTQNP